MIWQFKKSSVISPVNPKRPFFHTNQRKNTKSYLKLLLYSCLVFFLFYFCLNKSLKQCEQIKKWWHFEASHFDMVEVNFHVFSTHCKGQNYLIHQPLPRFLQIFYYGLFACWFWKKYTLTLTHAFRWESQLIIWSCWFMS